MTILCTPTSGCRLDSPTTVDDNSYRQTQRRITEIISRYGLAGEYERGSASYQHLRLNSAVRGLSISDPGTQLRDKEIDLERPAGYYRVAPWFVSVRVKVLGHPTDAVPEIRCDAWQARVDQLARTVAAVWHKLDMKFALESAQDDPQQS